MTGTSDFLGLNFYTGYYGRPGEEGPIPSLDRDAGLITTQDPAWLSSASSWLKVSKTLCSCVSTEPFNLIFSKYLRI
jgi:hypothetical protein